jgi:hypothetical protein
VRKGDRGRLRKLFVAELVWPISHFDGLVH